MVVSTAGLERTEHTELWLVYYGIFVRNAFGNFLNVVREVTYSPAMGVFLTHEGSSSFDYSGKFPNENYAREIMQLFMLGLYRVEEDGSPQRADGVLVNAYSNANILDFARIFTGFEKQPGRRNIEYYSDSSNDIDPMTIDPRKRDVFQKPNLEGGFIGDGHPHCDDALGRSFLAKAARYEATRDQAANPLVLDSSSGLYRALCGASSPCAPKLWTVLDAAIVCSGSECVAEPPTHVVAGGHTFKHVPAPCVFNYFGLPTLNLSHKPAIGVSEQLEGCNARPELSLHKRRRLDAINSGNTSKRREKCLEDCRLAGATGCELDWSSKEPGCYMHTGIPTYLEVRRDRSVGTGENLHHLSIQEINSGPSRCRVVRPCAHGGVQVYARGLQRHAVAKCWCGRVVRSACSR